MTDRWQYLILLGLCLLITAPLEYFGSGVYRQVRRTVWAILPVAVVFLVWDSVAIATGIWTYNSAYVTGIDVPPNIPIEEVLFFVVIPLCGLLTYNAVSAILDRSKRR
jgi:lycopene cyclase domain-containing protein